MSTSFTTVFFGPFHARVALDVTAPIECAPALFGPGELVSVVPSSTTQQVTAVHALRSPVTGTAVRAQRPGAKVPVAVVR